MSTRIRALIPFTIACAAVFAWGTPAKAPVDVRNGGDLIYCQAQDGAPLSGYYAADYVATYDSDLGDSRYLPVPADPLVALRDLLLARAPALGHSFERFLDDYTAQRATRLPDYLRDFIWVRGAVSDEPDEFIEDPIEANCVKADGKPDLRQTIVRDPRSRSNIYKYDERLLLEVDNEDRRLQHSFLITHEWLWQFAPNASVLRDANSLIQSAAFREYTGAQMYDALERVGLQLDDETLPAAAYDVKIDTLDGANLETLHIRFERGIGAHLNILNPMRGFFHVTRYYPESPRTDGTPYRQDFYMGEPDTGWWELDFDFLVEGVVTIQAIRPPTDGEIGYQPIGPVVTIADIRRIPDGQ
jgi:hypothetical protein